MFKRLYTSKTLYSGFVIVLLWYLLHFSINSAVIPSPHDTLVNFIAIFPKKLFMHLVVSLLRISGAIVISLVVGVAAGLWIGVNKRADSLVTPIVYMLYPLPKIAFLPILMILFGLGNTPKVILIVIVIIFQIILAARDGVKEIPKELIYSVTSLGLSRFQIYKHLIFPAVLPKIITSVRISLGVSIAVLFFAENFATSYGIGYFIMNSWVMVDYLEMFSGILALGIMGLLIFKLIDIAEDNVCGWIKAGKI